MFPLYTTHFPSSASDLEGLLNQSLQRLFTATAGESVTVRDKSFPDLKEIRVSLDGARLPDNPARPTLICGNASPALWVDQLTISAFPLAIGPAGLNLTLSARNATFVQGTDSDQELALAFQNAADGRLEVSITQADLAALVTQIAREQAGKQNITVEAIEVELWQNNEHSLTAQIRIQIRKLFVSASLNITGRLDLNDELNLRVSNLNCSGQGTGAQIACGFLNPYLRRIENREFPLMVLPMGEIHLRDVRVAVNERITVTAEFGSGTGSGSGSGSAGLPSSPSARGSVL